MDGRAGAVARAFHWIVAALMFYMFLSGIGQKDFGPAFAIPIHKGIGIVVLTLTLGRIFWWLNDRQRPTDAELQWEKWPSRLAKWGLLTLTLAVPLAGWTLSSYSGKPISIVGLLDIPLLPATPDKEMKEIWENIHAALAYSALTIAVLHIAGALRHHFILKDGVLRRMLPPR